MAQTGKPLPHQILNGVRLAGVIGLVLGALFAVLDSELRVVSAVRNGSFSGYLAGLGELIAVGLLRCTVGLWSRAAQVLGAKGARVSAAGSLRCSSSLRLRSAVAGLFMCSDRANSGTPSASSASLFAAYARPCDRVKDVIRADDRSGRGSTSAVVFRARESWKPGAVIGRPRWALPGPEMTSATTRERSNRPRVSAFQLRSALRLWRFPVRAAGRPRASE